MTDGYLPKIPGLYKNFSYGRDIEGTLGIPLIPAISWCVDSILGGDLEMDKNNDQGYLDISNWGEFDYVLTIRVNTKEEANNLVSLLLLFRLRPTVGTPVQLPNGKFIVGVSKDGPETKTALVTVLNYLRSQI